MFIARDRGRSETSLAACPATGASESGAASSAAATRRGSDAACRRAGWALWLLVVGAVLAGCGSSNSTQGDTTTASRFEGMAATGLSAPEFALRDQHGQLVHLSAERGKFVVITFLYVHCTNVCPVIAGQLNQALRELGGARSQVRVLAVSVDPKGDTPAAVAHFIAEHHLLPQFLYLTGSAKTLEPVWRSYHIASTQTGNSVVVGHTAIELLLDRSGRPQVVYDSTVTSQQVIHDLHVLGLRG